MHRSACTLHTAHAVCFIRRGKTWTELEDWNGTRVEGGGHLFEISCVLWRARVSSFFLFFFLLLSSSSVYWIWCIDRGASRERENYTWDDWIRCQGKKEGEEEAQAPKHAAGFVYSVNRSCSLLKRSGDTVKPATYRFTIQPTSLPSAAVTSRQQHPHKHWTVKLYLTTTRLQTSKREEKRWMTSIGMPIELHELIVAIARIELSG